MIRRKFSSAPSELAREMFEAGKCIDGRASRLLDVGDKDPVAALMFASKYTDLEVSHYKDNNVITRVSSRKDFPGVELINTYSELERQAPYDILTNIYALHEFVDPKKNLGKSLSRLRDGGIFVCKDYDLLWVPKLFKKNKWSVEEGKSFFSKYVFMVSNEKNVLGMEDGGILSEKKLRRNSAKGVEVEPKCVEQHTKFGREYYANMFSDLGIEELVLESHEIETPEGTFPKTFLYVGRKHDV